MSNLSEEEIIENVKDFIISSQEERNFIYYSQYKYENEMSDYIQGLLDLYRKEKEKNKELEDERKKYPIAMTDKQFKQTIDNAQKELKEELQRQINTREIEEKFIEKNYISKDKIRERIEEIRKIFPNDVMFTREFLITELQVLL